MENLEQPFPENLSTTSTNVTKSPKPVREYSDPIPVDILIDIFSRLPGKTTIRFRCVSKFWGYILRRPDFTELFLTKSSTRPRILFTVVADGKLFFYSSPQPQNPDDNSTLVATRCRMSFPKCFPLDNCSQSVDWPILREIMKERSQ
uniref:Putative F-box protein n=1 Tax=Noccaea caerulescens TaxID=107243 RepID=A0A1J3K7Q2_NOCCA